MEVKWLVEDYMGDNAVEPLTEELKKLGLEFKVVRYFPFQTGNYDDFFDKEDCVVFYGSLNLCRQLLREHPYWVPNAFYDDATYLCSNYYPHWCEYLLNANCVYLPFQLLLKNRDFIYNDLFKAKELFIRPDNGYKSFTGCQVHIKNFGDFVSTSAAYMDESNIWVQISPVAEQIEKEYRFIIAGDEPITSCIYCENGKTIEKTNDDDESLKYVELVLSNVKHRPHKIFVLDICLLQSGEYKVLELGAVSCAGLYKCDPAPIAEKMTQYALEEWKEIYET